MPFAIEILALNEAAVDDPMLKGPLCISVGDVGSETYSTSRLFQIVVEMLGAACPMIISSR